MRKILAVLGLALGLALAPLAAAQATIVPRVFPTCGPGGEGATVTFVNPNNKVENWAAQASHATVTPNVGSLAANQGGEYPVPTATLSLMGVGVDSVLAINASWVGGGSTTVNVHFAAKSCPIQASSPPTSEGPSSPSPSKSSTSKPSATPSVSNSKPSSSPSTPSVWKSPSSGHHSKPKSTCDGDASASCLPHTGASHMAAIGLASASLVGMGASLIIGSSLRRRRQVTS